VALHAWELVPHVAGGVQTPLAQVSVALQHGVPVEQLWEVLAHTGVDDAAHLPLVAPAGTSQRVPAQQSASTVQLASGGWQEEPAPVQSAHLPLVQVPLQQVAPVAQAPPLRLQVVPGAVPSTRQA
jgi:hypothetical protein